MLKLTIADFQLLRRCRCRAFTNVAIAHSPTNELLSRCPIASGDGDMNAKNTPKFQLTTKGKFGNFYDWSISLTHVKSGQVQRMNCARGELHEGSFLPSR